MNYRMSRPGTLPTDITQYIRAFVPAEYLVNTNRLYYQKHNTAKRCAMSHALHNSYVRAMVRNDNEFILKYLIKQYSVVWMKKKSVKYKHSTYKNYYDHLVCYSIDQESTKCSALLKINNNRDIKEHKNVRSKKYKWRT